MSKLDGARGNGDRQLQSPFARASSGKAPCIHLNGARTSVGASTKDSPDARRVTLVMRGPVSDLEPPTYWLRIRRQDGKESQTQILPGSAWLDGLRSRLMCPKRTMLIMSIGTRFALDDKFFLSCSSVISTNYG